MVTSPHLQPGPRVRAGLHTHTEALTWTHPPLQFMKGLPGIPPANTTYLTFRPQPPAVPSPPCIKAQQEQAFRSKGTNRHAGQTQQQRTPTACTMLLVDGGFPIDVIFDASVWERRKGKKRRETAG